MSYAKVHSAQAFLLKPYIVDVEADLSRGLNSFSIVGLGDKAVDEAKDRISAAVKNSGFESPKSKNHKVVISLAPAEVRKEGSGLDVAIALSYLKASGDIIFDAEDKIFLGELSLDGRLRPIKGVLAFVREAKNKGFKEIFLPLENAKEATLIDGVEIYGVRALSEIINHIMRESDINQKLKPEKRKAIKDFGEIILDLADIKGQETAKRALEIAAAGGHNIALYGPPGTGKTMLAKALSGILPPLSFDEVLEVTEIHSMAGSLDGNLVTERPFRSPHHTASHVAIIGGGSNPKPGEVTLAHKGVLFLDEFPEFENKAIEALREPLEERVVSVSRAKGTVKFPAHFILIAAMNPCPCGNFGIKGKPCTCSPMQIERYKKKISGPIIDRIDIWTEVSRVDHEKLTQKAEKSESLPARARIIRARNIQDLRFKKTGRKINTNSEMSARDITTVLNISDEVKDLLNKSARALDLSARSYHKIIKLARTIADLDSSDEISPNHILEAISYRPKTSKY
ncbi:MAG: YifB family Mg chelatase-like AAA ATPase [Candidatus Zambryskibacteria bacterium]|nr:YifB family Mg chelatase-like AAA ATPase [Candidatus Zambryskibacteria bacterium]